MVEAVLPVLPVLPVVPVLPVLPVVEGGAAEEQPASSTPMPITITVAIFAFNSASPSSQVTDTSCVSGARSACRSETGGAVRVPTRRGEAVGPPLLPAGGRRRPSSRPPPLPEERSAGAAGPTPPRP